MYVSEPIQIILFSFLIGSIPFGVLLAKMFGLPDPRTIGSGNIGATNMLRAGNKKVALLTLLLDAGKGAAAVLITYYAFYARFDQQGLDHVQGLMGCDTDHCVARLYDPSGECLALLFAALGHMFSPWLKCKGGKGVATILGGLIALDPWIAASFAVSWLAIFLMARYVSLASIVALAVVPAASYWLVPIVERWGFGAFPTAILATASLIAIWKHRANIARLRAGTEPKMGGTKHA